MSEEIKVDWTKAPEGATHYNLHNNSFYKADEGICYIYLQRGWDESFFDLDEIQEGDYFISRPAAVKAQQSFEWKIKHIKSDDYKCGRDVALTILYKDIGDGYYEYKYAICNTTDMFSRKKGVEAALDKPDTWKVYIGNYKTKGALQIIVWHLPFTRKMSREVVDLLLDEGFYGS